VVLSSNGSADITGAHCWSGSPINKPLCSLCKPQSPEAFTYAVRLPKIFLELAPSSTSLELAPSLSPPHSLCAIIPYHGWAPFMRRQRPRPELVTPSSPQHRHHPRARDAAHVAPFLSPWCHHPCTIPGTTTPSSSPSPWCQRPHTIPGPARLLSTLSTWCRCPSARDAVIPTPLSSPSLRCHRLHAIPELATLSSSPSPQCYIVYFPCHFGPTNPEIDMLHCHIALICYIAFFLLHCFYMLLCPIALTYYIDFVPLHFFDMLIAALLWYATHCYIAFVLLHFDLYECILHCSMTKVG
jgi:hypothetical protein